MSIWNLNLNINKHSLKALLDFNYDIYVNHELLGEALEVKIGTHKGILYLPNFDYLNLDESSPLRNYLIAPKISSDWTLGQGKFYPV